MSNMSYCRFENTASDLADCYEALCNGEGDDDKLNQYELRGKKRLLDIARRIVNEFIDVDEDPSDEEDEDTPPPDGKEIEPGPPHTHQINE